MRSLEIRRTWSSTLVSALQQHYGLSEDEATAKVDKWLRGMSRGTWLYPLNPAPAGAGLDNRRQEASGRRRDS
jgi:hypothetical protein